MPDPDLEMGGGGGGGGGRHQDPYKRGGGLQKIFFRSVCVKIRGGGVGSPIPSPGSVTDKYLWAMTSSTNEFHYKQTG